VSTHLPFVDLLLLRAIALYALDAEPINGSHLSRDVPPLPHAMRKLSLAHSFAGRSQGQSLVPSLPFQLER